MDYSNKRKSSTINSAKRQQLNTSLNVEKDNTCNNCMKLYFEEKLKNCNTDTLPYIIEEIHNYYDKKVVFDMLSKLFII